VDRRRFLRTTLGAVLAAPLGVEAQQAGTVYRIGFLSSSSRPLVVEAFRHGLRDLGWVEGQNVVIEYRFSDGKVDPLSRLADELVRLKVDVITAGPTPPAMAAKNATSSIPIVMMGVAQPVELGLIASFARPGGNITGVSWSVDLEIIAKGLELIKDVVPKIRRVAILWNPANPAQALAIKDVKLAAQTLGVQLQLLETRAVDEFGGAFAAMARQRAEAVLVVADALFVQHRARLADLEAKHRLPSMHGLVPNVEAGGLMSYGPDIAAVWRRAAFFVDKILKGTKPGDLPVERPTKFDLVVNLKTAKALGLTIPPSLLARADQVIE
jgi:ABC-type uncharacterized transport system substrate-binding protein